MGHRWAERLHLDTETTGLSAGADRPVEVAIVDEDGAVMLDTLVDPGMAIPPDAQAIHGITDEMVAGAPGYAELTSSSP